MKLVHGPYDGDSRPYETFPMPGDRFVLPEPATDKIVVASTVYSESDLPGTAGDTYLVLLLEEEPPFFTAMYVREVHYGNVGVDGLDAVGYTFFGANSHYNIVHAINGDDYPNLDPDRVGYMVGPRRDGYVDMGGDV